MDKNLMKNELFYWSERGLVSTFFIDLYNADTKLLQEFIDSIVTATGNKIYFNPVKMRCVIEPDFSNTGFGHPDALFMFENYNEEKIVFIFEAKRGSYSKSIKSSSLRGTAGYNSSLNGQLELNYSLALALSNFDKCNDNLIEPDWILKTNYNNERKGYCRSLKNKNVIKNVALPVAGLNIKQYYHLILTNENKNPLLENNIFPEIFDSEGKNIWNEYKKQFGWINFDKLLKLASKFENSLFLPTYEFNKSNLYSTNSSNNGVTKKTGVKLVYIPEINNKTFLHFSYKGESCRLRNYNDQNITLIENSDYTTSEVEQMIIKEIPITKKRPKISDCDKWREIIKEKNKKNKL